MAGVGVLMITGQLGKTTGVPVEGDTVVSQLKSFLRGLGEVHGPAVVAVAVTLLVGGTVLARFPLAALGAIVTWAATRLIDVREFR